MPEQDTATKPVTFLGIKMKARPAGTNTGKEVPEKNANIVSRTLFSWMTPLLVVRLSPVFSLRAFADIVRFPPTKQTGVTRPVSLVLLACVGLDCGGDRCPRGTSIWMCYVDRDPLASTSSCSARARRYLVSVCSLTPQVHTTCRTPCGTASPPCLRPRPCSEAAAAGNLRLASSADRRPPSSRWKTYLGLGVGLRCSPLSGRWTNSLKNKEPLLSL